tara:strand:+ start:3012 stop:4811 length:1800 start_codon:yes stop_codon:yes gene_type:complete
MSKKIVPVDYTSADFEKIKKDLLNYAKRYYPETYKDFNEVSFGSLMTDLVSYVGDNLSFYLDYQANESFINTSLEYDNVLAHARQLGYKHSPVRSSVGEVDVYIPVPADNANVAPDLQYLPKMLKGTLFTTVSGNTFTLNKDIEFFSNSVEVVGSEVSSDGSKTTYYILRARGEVVSGQDKQAVVEVGDFKRFLKLPVPGAEVSEIISVVDSNGNEYYEVDYLSQNTVYRSVVNRNESLPDSSAPSVMKPFPVPRRFVVERNGLDMHLVFGYGSEAELKDNKVADPSEVVMQITGKNYISDATFDPSKLLSTDKFGVAPTNTDLVITYRTNNSSNVNAAAGTLNAVIDPLIEFRNIQNLDTAKINFILSNIQIFNEDPINGDISVPTTEEIKRRANAAFAMQGRAVTLQDYVSATYAMPASFGAVKRAAIYRDTDDLRRNLNMYVISENSEQKLEKSSTVLKNNLKTWLNSVRMINDSLDILDATIINLGVEFDVIAQKDINKNNVFNIAKESIFKELNEIKPEIGEPFQITEVFRILKDVQEVLDVVNIKITSKTGSQYSTFMYDIESNISPEGRTIYIPHNCIWEIKFKSDIVGSVR